MEPVHFITTCGGIPRARALQMNVRLPQCDDSSSYFGRVVILRSEPKNWLIVTGSVIPHSFPMVFRSRLIWEQLTNGSARSPGRSRCLSRIDREYLFSSMCRLDAVFFVVMAMKPS